MNEELNSILDTIEAALASYREQLQDAVDYWRALRIEPVESSKEIDAIDAALTWIREQRKASEGGEIA